MISKNNKKWSQKKKNSSYTFKNEAANYSYEITIPWILHKFINNYLVTSSSSFIGINQLNNFESEMKDIRQKINII